MIRFFKRVLSTPWIAFLVFYGWNILGILLLLVMESSYGVFTELIHRCVNGYTPWVYLIQTFAILMIPLVCFVIGILKFRKTPNKLIVWFYGVEIPLLVLGIIRIAAVNDFNGHALWFFLYLLSGVLLYGFSMLYPEKFNGQFEAFFRVLFFMIGLQVVLFLLLYIVPMSTLLLKAMAEVGFTGISEILKMSLAFLVFALFSVLTGSLFILSPFAFSWLWIVKNGRVLLRSLRQNPNYWLAGTGAFIFAIWAILPAKQAQEEAFDLVAAYNEEQDNQFILQHEDKIKEGLVNAYLQDYRYLDRTGKKPVYFLYKEAFGYEGEFFDRFHDILLDAFLYHGKSTDVDEASVIYQTLFDTPIERGEKYPILYTLGSAFAPTNGEATILSIDQKEVLVTDRDIDYKDLGDGWVQVDFHERYLNQTFQNQEIFYYFSMPESGVLTDMWLGNSDEAPREFEAMIAPRGAAQQVYTEERERQRDPSLLEQVGPNQYRLRVFPIQAKPYQYMWSTSRRKRFDEEAEGLPPLVPSHLTLRMLLKTDSSGHLAFPIINEKRKVYWEEGLVEGANERDWFPKMSPVFSTPNHRPIYFDGWEARSYSWQNLAEKEADNYVFCYDASYSINKEINELNEAIAAFPYPNKTPIYGFNSKGIFKSDWTEKSPEFIGPTDPTQAIEALTLAHPNLHIIYLTDQGSYELLTETARTGIQTIQPIDIVHLGKMAPIYEDALNDAVLKSGGDYYINMQEWLTWHKRLPRNKNIVRDQNQYWNIQPFLDDTLFANSPVIAPAASRLALAASRRGTAENKDLDQIHELAIKYRFVSPFSSMICLVNDVQKKRLENLSNAEDRYQREVESGKDSGNGFDMSAAGVPEPEEWIMMILAAGLLLYLYRKRIHEVLPWKR